MPEENKEKTQKKRWTLKKVKTRCRTIYWQNFLLTASVVMLTLALLGSAFFALTYSYAIDERSEQMQSKATVVSHMVSSYMENGSLTGLRELADFASNVTDAEFLICNSDGNLLLTTDTTLVNRVLTVPQDVAEGAMSDDTYAVRTTLGDIYEDTHFVVGVPIVSEGATVGFVLAVTGARALTTMWRTFIGLFFMTAVTVLLLSFVVSAWVSMRQSRPIHEMAEATRRFAEGNFDVRMHNYEGVTEISELAESFNNMADSLQETERQRREFIANVSHELKTPMTTIAGFIDGILDGTIPPERQSHYLHIVSDEVKRLSRLVRTMLNLSRIDNGELKLRPNDFDISETVLSTVLTFEKSIDEKKIDIRGLDTLQPMQVHGDEDLLHQVVYNLVENAVKFTNTEGYISFNVSDSIDRIVVTIENSGSGIQSDELPLVFEKFYKTDKSRSQDKNGMGLGLYLVRTIIKLHGGDISVSSVVNEYTRFSFYIPKPQEPPKLKYNTGSIPVTVPVEDAVISERPKKEHHGHKDNKEPDQK